MIALLDANSSAIAVAGFLILVMWCAALTWRQRRLRRGMSDRLDELQAALVSYGTLLGRQSAVQGVLANRVLADDAQPRRRSRSA